MSVSKGVRAWMAEIEAAAMVPAGMALEYQFVVVGVDGLAILRCYAPIARGYDGWLVRLDGGPTAPAIEVARFRDGGTTVVDSALVSFCSPTPFHPEREPIMVRGRWGAGEDPPRDRRIRLVQVYPWAAP